VNLVCNNWTDNDCTR
jgi:phosphoserine aminotransferase